MNEGFNIKGKSSDKLMIFDLDDTLVISKAKIKVMDAATGSLVKELTPAEYNTYVEKEGRILNFDDFQDYGILRKSKLTKYMLLLKHEYQKGTHICILTARQKSDMIREFFLYHKIDILPQLVIAIGDPKWNLQGSTAERKQEAIIRLIKQGYKDLTFFDDNAENLQMAKSLEESIPNVSINTVKV
ncbi:MAG: hypothetical protein WC979_01555 [Candidatus Pacearchaeota archaeon]|jgi:hypothetical protein|nr:hypothetical protein [Clostridia bacterium]